MPFEASCGRVIACAVVALPLLCSSAHAQLAVSANDGKAVLVDGVSKTPASPAADTVSIIDLNVSPPKVVGEVKAPASVVGPPMSVAVAPDESIAVVTGAMKIDPADATKSVPDNKLSVIDLKATPPAVVATLEAGLGAAGVSFNRAGSLVLVANRSEGTVSIFTVNGKTLTPAGKVDFGAKASGPSHAVFSVDGKTALVTRDGDNKVSVLSVDGSKVEYTKRDLGAGLRPYGIDVSSKGDAAVVANIGTGAGDADTVSVIDIAAKPPRVVDTITVGQTPEGLKLSPDGQYAAVAVMNGSNKPKSSPFFNDNGLLKIYRLEDKRLTPVTEAKVGHWCQGIAFSKDSKTVLVQCMVENEIMVFDFDGKTLTPKPAIKVTGPAGIRTAEK
ncbi:beta-propeller fold lactonase family protein [Bradyrhizobium sp. SYSU BS000235]|uniref:YncE family protein n=1 Tax=Bradyrhizobium sp. SYSU BS000235 TaxID=3411332 RepID=UPI003C792A02